MLAEFPSVVEAFYCAIAIQQALAKANAALAEGARMYFRIGINVGDVMVKDGDIFGDGVNIAARVEALAEPGGICITRGVRDHLRDRVDTVFEDLGEHRAKNIARPVRVFRAVFDQNTELGLPLNRDLPSGTAESIEGAEPPSADAAEIAFWESVQASDDDAEYEIYLERYPVGTFADLARSRLGGTSAVVEDTGVELAFWESVRDSNNPEMIRAYLKKYPKGEFASLASILLASLDHPPQ